ncbi:DHHC zinc finger domain containing protein [Trichomonas vaginalis G3]|uniref:Palmitoyltransferase n=1 Tax=Trichomonas vaginalis (strain ATCC PRA-98 / G3) TaxID=412133 RepID=A2DPX8_TRIV3|nr:cysteine S-palmitoyltransferase protein [Trichomonas vaginalis G3]EAY17574.1 DHHC zinc finger domain containing protein [Trichomonas vaginalis G3]KAI5520618.1 cysteine S-palmitoyltransferase protein [Trichomonas vaginalis G3]|eukprot:XP_001329709.1 DHHC zinc finger domain containing protein [Trichomonas vaginalis G3]
MSGAYLYEGKLLQIKDKVMQVPKFSTWEQKCDCHCFKIAYFPEIKTYYCNDWEMNCTTAIFSTLVVLLLFAFELWSLIENYKEVLQMSLIIVGCVIHFSYIISHLLTMCTSPGYLPWFWNVERRKKYSQEEKWSGIITNEKQKEFALSGECPDRSIVSSSARRIVLRADVNCGWIANWIGVKNIRYFIIMQMWLLTIFIYYFAIFIMDMIAIKRNGWKLTVPRLAFFISIIPIVITFIYFIFFILKSFKLILHNKARLFEEDTTNPYDLNNYVNCMESFGPSWCCPLWLFPLPFPAIRDGFAYLRNDGQETNGGIETANDEKFNASDFFVGDGAARIDENGNVIQGEDNQENSDNAIYLLEEGNNFYIDQGSSTVMTTGPGILSESDLSMTGGNPAPQQDFYLGAEYDKTVTGQKVDQTMTQIEREKHRVRKQKIGSQERIKPPENTNYPIPRLKPFVSYKPAIEVPEKDGPVRFFFLP